MSIFRVRKVAFINFGLLLMFLAGWIFWYMYPLVRTITKEFSSEYGFAAAEWEEHFFYGKVSYAAVPSLFGGSNIPFFDKVYFQLNGDSKCTFVLYANDEILDYLAEWFDFSASNASEIPMEVRAIKVGDKFIVKSMASKDGELSWEDLMDGYHFLWCFVGVGLVGCMFGLGLLLIFVALVRWPRWLRLRH
jgi:4-amino-4-deoxy-L-arabinose transferase-like glycosyltransferase